MLTVRVRVRNVGATAYGLPTLAELKVKGEVLGPDEEREFEFTEEEDFKIKAQLTEQGEEMKKAIEEADKAAMEDKEETQKEVAAREKEREQREKDEKEGKKPGEKKELTAEQREAKEKAAKERQDKIQGAVQRQIPGGAPVSPAPKVENPPPAHGGARDSHDVKGQAPASRR